MVVDCSKYVSLGRARYMYMDRIHTLVMWDIRKYPWADSKGQLSFQAQVAFGVLGHSLKGQTFASIFREGNNLCDRRANQAQIKIINNAQSASLVTSHCYYDISQQQKYQVSNTKGRNFRMARGAPSFICQMLKLFLNPVKYKKTSK